MIQIQVRIDLGAIEKAKAGESGECRFDIEVMRREDWTKPEADFAYAVEGLIQGLLTKELQTENAYSLKRDDFPEDDEVS